MNAFKKSLAIGLLIASIDSMLLRKSEDGSPG